jgi:hypothetical protein
METSKKSLVDVALNVGGKSGTSGTVTIGSTPKNKKGIFDLSLDIGSDPRKPQDDAAEENQDMADATRRTGRFALSLGLLPSVAGGLLNIGIDVLGGKNKRGHRKHNRRARKNGSAKTERSASE